MRKTAVTAFAALLAASLAGSLAAPALHAADTPLRPDRAAFRETYRELVETNTTLSEGDCTLAATRMMARLSAAGIPGDQLIIFKEAAHPREGGLVAIYPGTAPAEKAILLLAHIDVVEAKRADWTRDPFTLVEENGYFYARGALDDKAMAAIWTDTLIRFAKAGYKPRRTVKLALTCGEETSGAFNGAEFLSAQKRDLIDAAYALNEGGGGRRDASGKLIVQTIQIGEKAYQDFTLTAVNPGGHSSQPVPQNAIYDMADALAKLRGLEFPHEFNDTTRAYFAKAGAMRKDETGKAMIALAANPQDSAALAVADKDKLLHSLLRTTCVATLVDGGHALNALPQTVTANVNCRMFPGRTAQETQAAIVAAIANPAIKVEPREKDKPIAKAPPYDPAIVGPMEQLSKKHFPGVPVVPAMSTGATDAVYTGAAGIPTYGVPGIASDSDGNGTHGLNERLNVAALYAGRDYLYDLVKLLAGK